MTNIYNHTTITPNIDYKNLIIFNLKTLILHHQTLKESFKVNAYKKAMDKIKSLDMIRNESDVQNVGGDKTKEKLKIIIQTNKNLPQVEEILSNTKFSILNELLKIHGIGPAKANELVEIYNIRSISELKKNENLLNDIQKRGLKYHSQITKRIPREEMREHDIFLQNILKGFNYKITGSYRRGAMDSGDIDILLSGSENDFKLCKKILFESKYLLKDGVFADGDHKLMGLCRLKGSKIARRIDMLNTPIDEYPFAILYFTGSSQFNISMRTHALSLGYSLCEQGLFHINTKEKVKHVFETEKDIFEYLNFPFVNPNERI